MYDLAKRSLAFAVATGGLLLTGTAYSPAFAVAGSGAIQGPAQAQGVRIDADFASSPVNAAPRDATAPAGFQARAAQAPPGSLPPEISRPYLSAPGTAVAADTDAPIPACGETVSALIVRNGTAWTYCATDSGTAGYGAPAAGAVPGQAKMLIEVCGNTVTAGPIESFESGSSCTNTAEGSAPTVPGAPAPATGGASATAVSMNDTQAARATDEQAPAAGSADSCGDGAGAGRILTRHGGGCGTVRAEAAGFGMLGRRSGGLGDAGGTRMSAPSTDCRDMVPADDGEDGHGATKCADSPTWPDTSPSPSPSPSPSQCKCVSLLPIHPAPPPPPPPPAPSRHPWKCGCPHTWPTHPAPPPPPPPPPMRHPWKCGCAHTAPPPPPPPPTWPPTKCTCSKPPTSPPPTHSWPPTSPPPMHSWPPSWPASPSASPSAPSGWPSNSSWPHPGGPPHNGNGGGGLAHTGTDIGIALGVAGAALLGGLGLRAASRRREGQG